MCSKQEDEIEETLKREESQVLLSTRLSAGSIGLNSESAKKREIFRSNNHRDLTPPSPHLFSHQKAAMARLVLSPFLPLRSPESVVSRYMGERNSDTFDQGECRRPQFDNILNAFGEARPHRRISFGQEQEDLAHFGFSSPAKMNRLNPHDLGNTISKRDGGEKEGMITPERELAWRSLRRGESTAEDTSERKRHLMSIERDWQQPRKLSLTSRGENCDPIRASKGLKTLSQRVKDIVSEKRKTTYKEVASILIEETRAAAEHLSVKFSDEG